MTTDHRTEALHNERPRSLGMTRVEIQLLHPVRLAVATFDGPRCEPDADEFLHNSSLALARDGNGTVLAVSVRFTDGRTLDSIHHLRYADTDGSIRGHMASTLAFLLRHVACPRDGRTVEELRDLLIALRPSCATRYTAMRLKRLTRQPPPLDDYGREAKSGRDEVLAALLHALKDGLAPEAAVHRARSVAQALAPRVLGRAEYDYGMDVVLVDCRAILAGRPLRRGRCIDGS